MEILDKGIDQRFLEPTANSDESQRKGHHAIGRGQRVKKHSQPDQDRPYPQTLHFAKTTGEKSAGQQQPQQQSVAQHFQQSRLGKGKIQLPGENDQADRSHRRTARIT